MTREQWALLLNADPHDIPRIARLIDINKEVWE
jgi:hypothetical protein